jgi:YidC/Oxa1 family membrane protein insertase
MDKNQATGLILFAAVILIYSLFFASGPEIPAVEEIPQQTEAQTSVSPQQVPQEILPDSLIDAKRIAKYGVLASLTVGEEADVILENDNLKITLSTKGAEIREVIIKGFKRWDMEPLALLDENSSTMNFSLESPNGPLDFSE